MEDYAGVYTAKSNKGATIILFKNGTYNSCQTNKLNLDPSGTWETGGVDGMFKFYNQQQHLTWAIPSLDSDGHEISFNNFVYSSNDFSEPIIYKRK